MVARDRLGQKRAPREPRARSEDLSTSCRCKTGGLSKHDISIVFIGRAYSPARSTGKQHDRLMSGHLLIS